MTLEDFYKLTINTKLIYQDKKYRVAVLEELFEGNFVGIMPEDPQEYSLRSWNLICDECKLAHGFIRVVINNCHGGFGISPLAFEELIKKGWTTTEFNEEGYAKDKEADIIKDSRGHINKYNKDFGYCCYFNKWDYSSPELRTNKDLIEIIEKLGEKANSSCSKLKIIEIPDNVDWRIAEYDGLEWVCESHCSWS